MIRRAAPPLAALLLALVAACVAVRRGYYVFEGRISGPDFRDVMSAITDRPMVGGNRVAVLENGVGIFPAMKEAIAGARESIHLETYIFNGDATGMAFADLLTKKAREGVEVRVLYDSVGSRHVARWTKRVRRAGGRAVAFVPFRVVNMVEGNRRTHRKVLVVDGRIGFTGGVGISREWEGDADAPDHWRETQVRVEGPVVAQLQSLFAENWERSTGEDLRGDARYFPEPALAGDSVCGVVGAVRRPGEWGKIREMWLLPLATARRYFYLNIAYFVPDPDVIGALAEAADRGVDVRFIVPGPANDLPAVRYVSMKHYGKLMDAGVRIFEYRGTNMHSKTGVCDDLWVTIGSANYDNRSFSLNYESNLVILDPAVARAMKESFARDEARSVEIDQAAWRERPFYQRFVEALVGVLEVFF
jgi:cardiolipin synthase